jgi:transglutaminase superfamily protein
MLAGSHSSALYATPLLGGDSGTEQTIRLIRSLVDSAWKDPIVNRTAIEIVRGAGVNQYDSMGQVRAIYDWVHGNFYFVNDPISKETLRPTRDLLQMRAGDCDDINGIVLPSLLGNLGYDVRVVTIAADPSAPDAFSHIYCEVYLDGAWYPLDAARPDASFGVAPPNYFRREWWSLTDAGHGPYEGDGAMSGYNFALRGLNGMLQSIGGQSVQPAIQGTIGPGGALMASPAPAPAGVSLQALLLVGLGLAVAWAVMKH